MALNKSVMRGGSYYKGYELIVSAAPGAYVLDMALDVNCVINSTSVTPDAYGAGDTFELRHMDSSGKQVALLGESIYNAGKNIAIMFDWPALEEMRANESLRLTYNNTAGSALNVHVIVEYGGILK